MTELDVISSNAWVEGEKENKDTCRVLFYKQQGEKIATDSICIDGTHGSNVHDFQLLGSSRCAI